ncbi:Binding partner of ACD11 1 [Camellia lanceoleosa]|uniref:Binding partner of ACD11 1 n=1 Tax=Camellia lanceoleosa TaxID=1840588 RepID=A0ACC0G5G7_9ERIC|nr:Binding partner of ACD11 1 [Camellia lanceoleosa]
MLISTNFNHRSLKNDRTALQSLQFNLEKKLIHPLNLRSPFAFPFFSFTITLSPERLNSITFGIKFEVEFEFDFDFEFDSSFSFIDRIHFAIAVDKLLLFSRKNFLIAGMSTELVSGKDCDRCIEGQSLPLPSLPSDYHFLREDRNNFFTDQKDMDSGAFTVEVIGLPPEATEKDVYDFFAFCGTIEHVDIVRVGEYACSAYVTFKDAYAMQTAVLLSGATLLDQHICITPWGHYEDEFDFWNRPSWKIEDETDSAACIFPLFWLFYKLPLQGGQFVPSAGEAVTMAQDVVKTMLAKGYVLGKDALSKAKAIDASHQVSATAVAKVAELSERIGLTDKFCAGVEAFMSVDQKYHISDTAKSAVSATGRTAVAAANSVVSSSYFSKGALWVSDALTRAAKVAGDLGTGTAKNEKLA